LAKNGRKNGLRILEKMGEKPGKMAGKLRISAGNSGNLAARFENDRSIQPGPAFDKKPVIA
jgi:hypothetical protein